MAQVPVCDHDCCTGEVWITQVKTSDQIISTSIATDIIDLFGFDPEINGLYEIESKLIVSVPATNIGARLALNFPSGLTHTAHFVTTADQSYSHEVFYYGGPSALTSNNNAPAANVGFLGHIMGIIDVGSSPGVGNVRPQAAVEPGHSNMTVHAGSMFKWRKIA